MLLKRLGFSLDEMASLTMSDFIALTDVASEPAEGGGAGSKPREATQDDIDRLLG